jgi:hypothetical protein
LLPTGKMPTSDRAKPRRTRKAPVRAPRALRPNLAPDVPEVVAKRRPGAGLDKTTESVVRNTRPIPGPEAAQRTRRTR